MNWLRKLLHLRPRPEVANTPDLPKESRELIAESKRIRRDLRELRQFEIVVRRR